MTGFPIREGYIIIAGAMAGAAVSAGLQSVVWGTGVCAALFGWALCSYVRTVRP